MILISSKGKEPLVCNTCSLHTLFKNVIAEISDTHFTHMKTEETDEKSKQNLCSISVESTSFLLTFLSVNLFRRVYFINRNLACSQSRIL